MTPAVTAEHREQFQREGYFVLESVIADRHLHLLRQVAGQAVEEMDAQMDREGSDTLGINHRGKRYFVGQTYATYPRLGEFHFDDLGDPIVVPAGSFAVFSSLVFHRSGANSSGNQRRAYLAQYAPTRIQNAPETWPQYFAKPFLDAGHVVAGQIGYL